MRREGWEKFERGDGSREGQLEPDDGQDGRARCELNVLMRPELGAFTPWHTGRETWERIGLTEVASRSDANRAGAQRQASYVDVRSGEGVGGECEELLTVVKLPRARESRIEELRELPAESV